MRITVQEPTGPAPVTAEQMLIGQLAEYDYLKRKHIVLRGYDILVSLTDPERVWDRARLPVMNVRLLQPGAIVTLTQDTALVGAPPSFVPVYSPSPTSPERVSRERIDSILFDADRREIRKLVRSGEIIKAIKLVREKTGEGLKEAKDYVDNENRNLSAE